MRILYNFVWSHSEELVLVTILASCQREKHLLARAVHVCEYAREYVKSGHNH